MEQIEKDIERSFPPSRREQRYTAPLLRKLLYALSNSGVEYSQGMNFISLHVMVFALESMGVTPDAFATLTVERQRDIFVVLREVVLRLEEVFDAANMTKVVA